MSSFETTALVGEYETTIVQLSLTAIVAPQVPPVPGNDPPLNPNGAASADPLSSPTSVAATVALELVTVKLKS